MIIDAQPEQPASDGTQETEQTESAHVAVEQEPQNQTMSRQEPFSSTEQQDHIFWLLLLLVLYLCIMGSLKLAPHFFSAFTH